MKMKNKQRLNHYLTQADQHLTSYLSSVLQYGGLISGVHAVLKEKPSIEECLVGLAGFTLGKVIESYNNAHVVNNIMEESRTKESSLKDKVKSQKDGV